MAKDIINVTGVRCADALSSFIIRIVPASPAKAYNPGFPYVLCVSNRKLHKNEARLVEAFINMKIGKEIKLIFTGDANKDIKN